MAPIRLSKCDYSAKWQCKGTLPRWISPATEKFQWITATKASSHPFVDARFAECRVGGGPGDGAPRGLWGLRSDMRLKQPDGGGQHCRVVGEADQRQHVGDEVERQHEIGERADQGDLD